MRAVVEADSKEFSDPHVQKLLESYRKKLLGEFKDTIFNSERINLEEMMANPDHP